MHEWLLHGPSLHYELNSGDKQTFFMCGEQMESLFFSNTWDLG